VFILVGCLYVLLSTSTRFLSEAKEDRDEMVASLRKAQTPEPQVMAISSGFDHITTRVHSMGISFFTFTSILLVTIAGRRQSDLPRRDIEHQPHTELRPDPVPAEMK
jgi:hypothetical protein